MCGIAGIKYFNGSRSDIGRTVKQMTDSIRHRGPDGEGFWIDDNRPVGLGHRRLSIIDLSENAAQPMSNGSLHITFNGEIYNYLELKKTLISLGYVFHSNSDTEVILIGYKHWGKNILEHLDGMFSFVIYDQSKEEFFCARDRFGEKPFYYFQDKTRFCFASEMKAIFAAGIEKKANQSMIYYYLKYNIVENPNDKSQTFYDQIKQLPASHYMVITSNGVKEIERYWQLNTEWDQDLNKSDAIGQFTELFDSSIKRRLRSDVPVGTSLSGGIDSSSIVSSVLKINPGIALKTFTARFNDRDFDEGAFIDILKQRYDLDSYFCYPDEERLYTDLNEIFHHQEEPFGSASIMAQWEVMKLARNNGVKVLLDGQGADETLGGYFKYFLPYLSEIKSTDKSSFNNELKLIESNLGINPISSLSVKLRLLSPGLHDSIAKLSKPVRNILQDNALNKEFRNEYKHLPSPFHQDQTLNDFLFKDIFNYGLGKLLRFSDRNSMGNGVEVRLPFLSHELVQFVFSLPPEFKMGEGWNKLILRESMKDRLPEEICLRKDKKGFQPPNYWINSESFNELVHEGNDLMIKNGFINKNGHLDRWQSIMMLKTLEQ